MPNVSVTVAILKQLTAYAYYGHAFGGDVIRQSQLFARREANYAYIESTVAF